MLFSLQIVLLNEHLSWAWALVFYQLEYYFLIYIIISICVVYIYVYKFFSERISLANKVMFIICCLLLAVVVWFLVYTTMFYFFFNGMIQLFSQNNLLQTYDGIILNHQLYFGVCLLGFFSTVNIFVVVFAFIIVRHTVSLFVERLLNFELGIDDMI